VTDSLDVIRTSVFYVLGAAVLATDIVSAPIGSWLLAKDVWLPFLLGGALMMVGFPILCFLPETLSPAPSRDSVASATSIDVPSEVFPAKVGAQSCNDRFKLANSHPL
jgi:hypothetical protein